MLFFSGGHRKALELSVLSDTETKWKSERSGSYPYTLLERLLSFLPEVTFHLRNRGCVFAGPVP